MGKAHCIGQKSFFLGLNAMEEFDRWGADIRHRMKDIAVCRPDKAMGCTKIGRLFNRPCQPFKGICNAFKFSYLFGLI